MFRRNDGLNLEWPHRIQALVLFTMLIVFKGCGRGPTKKVVFLAKFENKILKPLMFGQICILKNT